MKPLKFTEKSNKTEMALRQKNPPVFWWQTKSEINLRVDFMLDDLVGGNFLHYKKNILHIGVFDINTHSIQFFSIR